MYIGVDLGGTNIAVGLVDDNAKILHKVSVKTFAERPAEEILKDMAHAVLRVVEESGVKMEEIKSIGVGSPGSCDSKNGVLVYANNFKNMNQVSIRGELQKYIDKPVFLENDANVAALAEYVVKKEEMECFIAVTLGTGVGGGIIINGKVFSGFNGAGAELGHMVIVKDGQECNCGRKGCWEAYASATALIRQTKAEMLKNKDSKMYEFAGGSIENVGGKTAFDAARAGDPSGKKVVDTYIEYIAEGLANIINIFQPEELVIGGGICNEGDYLLKPIQAYVENVCYTKDLESTRISIAKLGNDAGIIGAAMLGL